MFDLIAVGDAGIDTLVDLHDATTVDSGHKGEKFLCLRYADKVLVEGMTTKTAYNGMNAAIAARRLGLNTALFAMVGDDAGGHRIQHVLDKEKVNCRYLTMVDGKRTNASVVIDFKGDRTILVYHEDFHYKLPRFDKTKAFYITTMGKRFWPIYAGVASTAMRTGAIIGFNPGSNQLKIGAKKMKPVLHATTALFLNKEEAQSFTRQHDGVSIKDLLKAMLKLGPKIAVITDGPKGSYASDGISHYHLPIFPAKVVERTGAGDSFGTAFTCALVRGKDMKEALRWGTFNAAGKVQKVGPQDGLLKMPELKRYLDRNPKFQPRSF